MAPSPGQHLSITSQQKKIIKTFSAVIIDIFFSKAATHNHNLNKKYSSVFSADNPELYYTLIFEIREKNIEDTALLPREKNIMGEGIRLFFLYNQFFTSRQFEHL